MAAVGGIKKREAVQNGRRVRCYDISAPRMLRAKVLRCRVHDFEWTLSVKYSNKIQQHFRGACRSNPSLFDGEILLLNDWRLESGCFHGSFFETSFASFLYWRDRIRDGGITNCSPAAVIVTADDKLLAVDRSSATKKPGIALPGGMPEPQDVAGRQLCLQRTLFRELKEELGLGCEELSNSPGWHIVYARSWLMPLKILHSRLSSEEMKCQATNYLSTIEPRELNGVYFVPYSRRTLSEIHNKLLAEYD